MDNGDIGVKAKENGHMMIGFVQTERNKNDREKRQMDIYRRCIRSRWV